ncbi:MAG: YkvA family protein [Patescibacteria group bacterium]|nr:YkvA family protein [Patescibacteria group bacterium]
MNHKQIPDIVGLGQFLVRKGTDWKPKAFIVLALLYLFFPVDILPDALPVAGLFDDAGLMALSLWWLSYATKKYNISLLGEGEASKPAELEEKPPASVIDAKGEEVKEPDSGQ